MEGKVMGKALYTIGFGTWKIKDAEMAPAIRVALECGYRHFDTAAAYENENKEGEALKSGGVERKDIFLSGKLWTTERAYDKVLVAFQRTVKNLKTDYLDSYLVHWPAAAHMHEDWEKINAETWRAFEKLYDEGYVRKIGVCNCKKHHIESFASHANIKPMINQIEFHPGCNQSEIVDYCHSEKIDLEAWSPLGSGKMMRRKPLQEMAERYGKSVAQLCLRYCIQKGLTPLPKSVSPARIKENMDIFDFQVMEEDMKRLDAMPYMGGSGLDADTVTIFG